MIFPAKKLSLVVTALALTLFTTRPAPAQMPDYSDIENLTGLRTMANTPAESQSGMEVGNVRVPSVTEGQTDLNEVMPEEKPAVQEVLPMSQILFDTSKIDPNQYTMGPEDALLLYLFGTLDKYYSLTVLPEGIVNIPTVGPVSVANMTLAQAKEAISREVLKKYKGITLSITLSRPRYFRVFASGQVRRPGAIDAHALMRVSDIINTAGLKSSQNAGGQGTVAMGLSTTPSQNVTALGQVSSQRSIIIHRDNEDISVDLIRFRSFGDLSSNPYVHAGDRIEVMPYLGSVHLYGQVNVPGRYEIKPGDRIFDMIRFAGGLTTVADTTRATLTRFDATGKKIVQTDIDLNDALLKNPDAKQYVLQDSDRLSIWAKYQYKRIENVVIRGEVQYPGTYPITSNHTTLFDIIDKYAGGFTDNANLEEATLIRQSSTVQDLEYQRLAKTPIADMTDEEKDLYKNMSRSRRGEISVDFVKLFRQKDSSSDILLQSGDVINIPVRRGFVNVMGAVQQPGFMRVEEGKSIDFYVSKAGGLNWNAKGSKIRIIKARTGQRFRASRNVLIEAGDTIHIPEKKPVDLWASFKDAATVFANCATIIILARQLKN